MVKHKLAQCMINCQRIVTASVSILCKTMNHHPFRAILHKLQPLSVQIFRPLRPLSSRSIPCICRRLFHRLVSFLALFYKESLYLSAFNKGKVATGFDRHFVCLLHRVKVFCRCFCINTPLVRFRMLRNTFYTENITTCIQLLT